MDEMKTQGQPQNTQRPAGGSHGGRRRRHKHNKGNGGGAQNAQNQQNEHSNQQNQQKQPTQHANPAAGGANAPVNNGNNSNHGNHGGKNRNRNKNKHKQGGGNTQQNQPQQQNKNNANVNANTKPQQPQQQNQPKQKNNGNAQQQQQQQQKKDTYLYALDGNLYVNLTNKCSNGCDFCVRNERDSYYGYYLWLRNGDPTVEKVIAAAKNMNLSQYKEVVFCGFGEPTYKVSEMVQLCDYFHEQGLKTRLNTNGQGNLINKRDIVPDLKGKIDLVNISLNFSCAEKYQPVCRSQFGVSAFEAILEFGRLCKRNEINCRFSIVDCIGEDEVEACKRLAESQRIPLYIRDYLTDSE